MAIYRKSDQAQIVMGGLMGRIEEERRVTTEKETETIKIKKNNQKIISLDKEIKNET